MATQSDIHWFGCGEPVSEERIAEVQRRFGVRFPAAFLDWVRACDGGDPGDLAYEVPLPGYDRPWTYGVGRLISFREPMPHDLKERLLVEPDAWRELGIVPWTSIEDYRDDPPEGLETGLVPFADTGSGDLLCFDWRLRRSHPDPAVVLWLHEFIDENPIVPVAPNFGAFVERLKVSRLGPTGDIPKEK